jgi:uncharacterized iron-regulated membrane protein
MAIAMMLAGALANALAFTGSSFLFSKLSKDSIDKERKRHDEAVEKLQKAQVKCQEKRQKRIDFINKRLLAEKRADRKFTELNDAMREYSQVFGEHLSPLPSAKPQLSDFYTPSDGQHERELAFIALGMVGIGGALYYFEKR